MKQTAVEFYHSELKKILYNFIVTPEQVMEMADALAQAKEIEKQQIIDAYENGYSDSDNTFKLNKQYYNETFNKKELPKTEIDWSGFPKSTQEKVGFIEPNIIDEWLDKNSKPEISKQVKEEAKEIFNDLLSNLINLNKRAISENWKMKDVGEEFFKTFAYSENNNGWIKIESENDLPKENGEYWTIRKNGIMIKEHFYLSNPLNWIKYYNVTHYQPVIKPQPPIY